MGYRISKRADKPDYPAVKINAVRGASHKIYMADSYYHIFWISASSWDDGTYVSFNRHGKNGGFNTLFIDGHVEYAKIYLVPQTGGQSGIDYWIWPTK